MNSNSTNFFQVRVQVRVQKFLFFKFEFEFGQNCRVLRVRVRSPGGDSTEDLTWLKDWVMQAQVSEIRGDDAGVTYHVAGYIGRCT